MGDLPQNGPLSQQDLFDLWLSTNDAGYTQPLVELGEGQGLEVYTQVQVQLARVSQAIDVTTQAMFILPFSGQSNPPAAGASPATVQLSFVRTARIDQPLVVGAGLVFFEELSEDWGDFPGDPGQPVLTGRKYALVVDLVFAPGEAGPLFAAAQSVAPGYGFNNPMPGSISHVDQPGSGFNNNVGSVFPAVFADSLVTDDRPDVVIPEHVGQYVAFTAGANAGRVRRMVAYVQPDLSASPPTGGGVNLERTAVIEGTFAGSPVAGESFLQAVTGATLVVQKVYARGAVLILQGGPMVDGTHALTGSTSGAVLTPTALALSPAIAAEAGTAEWRVLDWATDLGLSVTNPISPTGGRFAMLDGLGRERAVDRSPNESDDLYRLRVSTLADVVSPNAVLRAANRVLAPFGILPCFREAGLRLLPGIFFDGALPGGNDENAYDLDSVEFVFPGAVIGFQGERVTQLDPATGQVAIGSLVVSEPVVAPGQPSQPPQIFGAVRVHGTFQSGLAIHCASSGTVAVPPLVRGGLRPEARHKWLFDYIEMRAFFLIGVPTTGLGEFGMAYDAGKDPYDGSGEPFGFYDGSPVQSANVYRTLYQSVDRARAGGVSFDLEREDLACI